MGSDHEDFSSYLVTLTVLGRTASDQFLKIMMEGSQGSVSALSHNIRYLAVGILQKIASAVDLRVSDVSRVRDPNHGAECP